jgi:hypothetical protein
MSGCLSCLRWHLAHHRQTGQVGKLEPRRIDPSQPPGMERRPGDGAGQQGPQSLALVRGQPSGVPARAVKVALQIPGQGLAEAGLGGAPKSPAGSNESAPGRGPGALAVPGQGVSAAATSAVSSELRTKQAFPSRNFQ